MVCHNCLLIINSIYWVQNIPMNRRAFHKKVLLATAAVGLASLTPLKANTSSSIRLGGPIYQKFNNPEEWVAAVKAKGYRAAYCPVGLGTSSEQIRAYEQAAKRADIVIAEVGAWSNPISPDAKMAKEALDKCINSLALADEIGANCCVNISGSKNPTHWAGPHADNLTKDTFDQVVEVTRKIIQAVKPTRTHFTIEQMPWAFPDSVDTYLDLIKAIDHPQFGVHMDPMNLIVNPRLFYGNAELIKDCFKRLGPHIRSCHGKDIVIKEDYYMPQFTEVAPGKGNMDYTVFLTELSKLPNIPLMMEHLGSEGEYDEAAAHIRSVGEKLSIDL